MTRFPNDHFSAAAERYAAYRPRYPDALFAWLASVAPDRAVAWDCATGSGQAALGLAPHFQRVVGTDASPAQLAHAAPHPRIRYAAMAAECAALATGSIAVACVAQALHWFQREKFFAEAFRVLRPQGILAAWSYGMATVTPGVDQVVAHFYKDILGPWWPPERALVEAGYAALELPGQEVRAPRFSMEARWTLAQFIGYLGTWSAVSRYRAGTGHDPLSAVVAGLSDVWPGQASGAMVRWPLSLRVVRRPL